MDTVTDATAIVFHSVNPAEAEAVRDSLRCARLEPRISKGPNPLPGAGGEFYCVCVPPMEAVRARTILDVTAPPLDEEDVHPTAPPTPRPVTSVLLLLMLMLLAVCPLYVALTMAKVTFPMAALLCGACLGAIFAFAVLRLRRR